jgi:phage terminase large subunit GpA-like protein
VTATETSSAAPNVITSDVTAAIHAALARISPHVRAELEAVLLRIFIPGHGLNCWDWAHANIILTPEESRDHHGPYNGALTIYVKRLFDFITTPAEQEKELIIRKSAQLGFTLAYLIVICYVAATAPTHILFAMDSAKEAKNISLRIQRLLKTNAALDNVFTDEGEDDLQNLKLRLRGMDVHLSGSGSAGAFANKSVGLAILDELDKHVPAPGGHANTIDLARDRLKKVQQGKLVAGGTPASWEGETNQNFLTGTREELCPPCPHCGTHQPFRWEQIKFEHCKDAKGDWDYGRMLNETYHECVSCKRPIRDHHKPEILKEELVKWVVGNTGEDDYKPFPGRVSIWVNDLYSQDPQTSWGRMAIKFVDAQKSPSKLLNFYNESLGLPQKEKKVELSKSDLFKLTGGYEHGCMPKAPAISPDTGNAAIVVCSDVQATHKKWVKVGFTHTGEAFVIDYGQCLSYAELIAVADEPVFIGNTRPSDDELDTLRTDSLAAGVDFFTLLKQRFPAATYYVASVGMIDEGHDTFIVRDFCYATGDYMANPPLPPRFFPCKGVAHVSPRQIVEEITDKYRTAKEGTDAPFITVYHFNDDALKTDLYLGRIGQFDAIKEGKSQIPRLWLPAHVESTFIDELCQEKRAPVMYRGKITQQWLEPKAANDWGDALKMGLVTWHVINPQFPAPEIQQEKAA